VLRRYLEFRGARVLSVMNMTDVGHMVDDGAADGSGPDKISVAIDAAIQAQKEEEERRKTAESGAASMKPPDKKRGVASVQNPNDPHQVVQFFVDAFLEDARALQLSIVQQRDAMPVEQQMRIMPRPTQFIGPFIHMIQTLLDKGNAYIGTDGVVYYSVGSFPAYGRLSGNSVEQLSHGAGGRTAASAAKRHPADFFLWKPDSRHIMRWPSPWGEGYPGWHIECSSMATSLLGSSIDIHTGGEDNIFPHHECEIAQSEAATGQPFARVWLHNRHLMVDGKKMSKSKGNFYTIRDLVEMGFDPLAIRFALISTRYRESMNFSLQGLQEAASAVTTLRDLADKLQTTVASIDEAAGEGATELAAPEAEMISAFSAAMDDDLNIAAALGALFTWAAPLTKQKKVPFPQARSALLALKKLDHVLAVIFPPLRPLPADKVQQLEDLVARRNAARAAKNWAESDALRKELLGLGVEVKDTPTGTQWRPRLAPST
ncbi:MAG TPA: DALR domain-containing protein, partial [Phycisphaerae bacterium]|nr:DALR domain-containing protein [Phycisphaerae bacterium]